MILWCAACSWRGPFVLYTGVTVRGAIVACLAPVCTGDAMMKMVSCRTKPQAVSYGLGDEEHDVEGRLITAEFPSHYGVCFSSGCKSACSSLVCKPNL